LAVCGACCWLRPFSFFCQVRSDGNSRPFGIGSTTCTTSQSTSPNASGGAGKADGKPADGAGTAAADKPKDDLCSNHPDLNVCKNAQVQGGNCAGASDDTSCTGDAIACATLRQQRMEWCANSQVTPLSTLGNQLLAGSDPMASTLPTPANGQTVAVGALDQSGFLGGGSCFADKTFVVMGQTVVFSMTPVCPYLLPLRYCIMVIAGLSSLAMLRQSVLG
jgi:hypothetical protein